MSKFIKKNKIIIIGIFILIFFSIWVGQNIIERSSSQADEPRKAIFQQENMRGESGNVLTEPTYPLPTDKKEKTNIFESEETAIPSKNTEIVTIVAGQDKINLPVSPNTIFYDALIDAQNKGKITFSGKNYPGLGFFITDIGSLRAGNGKYLLYYIDGKEATVGVSQYVLKNGDVIEWKLE